MNDMDLQKQKLIELNHQNRWMLTFPDEYNIPEFAISKVSNLKCSNVKGVMTWKKFTITINDLIGVSITKNIVENLIEFPIIKIKKLNAMGEFVEIITISTKEIYVDFGKFDYSSEKLNTIKITVVPSRVFIP